MLKKLLFIIVALIVFLTFFFFPKPNGEGGSCSGCLNIECKCFGFERKETYIGPWHSTCYGIPYGCEVVNIFK
jgi:hypothetical protein